MVISPDYLTAAFNEVKKYSFVMQGYGNFGLACNGITKVNSKDLLGVAYVSYRLPPSGSSEFRNMLEFLKLLNLMEDKKCMVFVTQIASANLRAVLQDFLNVDVYGAFNEIEITDSVFNRKIFGTILLHNRKPYLLDVFNKEEKPSKLKDDSYDQFIVNPEIMQCIEPIAKLNSAQLVIENDKACEHFLSIENQLLYLIRKFLILQKFGDDTSALRGAIEKQLQNITDDVDWVILKNIIDRGDSFC